MSAVASGGGREPGQALRWTVAALVVAGLHAGAGWWVAGRSFLPATPPDGVAGVMVDLEPVAAPVPPTVEPKPMETSGRGPDKQVAEAPDAPPSQTEPQPESPPAEPPVPAPVPPPEQPPIEAAPSPPPEPAPPAPEVEPEPVQLQAPTPATVQEIAPPPVPAPSDAVVAPPPRPTPPKKVATPKPPKPVPPKPDPREVARQEARQEAREAEAEAREEARREARAKAAADARSQRQAAREQSRAARAAASREGGGADRESAAPARATSGAALSTWQGEVQAHMAAYTPSSPNGNAGTVKIAFSVARGGRITSASVSSSSGDPELDQAALSAVRRASPVPAPPPELGGGIRVAVPMRFH